MAATCHSYRGSMSSPPPSSSPQASSGLFSCCSSSKSTTDAIQDTTSPRAAAQAYHKSVYITAQQDGALSEEDLLALQQLEEAADLLLTNHSFPSLASSGVFVDAQETERDDWSYLMTYMPATVANTHVRGSVAIDDLSSLLATPAGLAAAGADGGTRRASLVVRNRLSVIIGALQQPHVSTIKVPGYPGELTEHEVDACLRFRTQLEEKARAADDPNGRYYREIVDAFHSVEEEPYALCRFLRARKFDVDAVMDMVEQGVDIWAEGKKHNFFPDASVAVGNPISVFRTQYPVVYSGIAKNGCPVSYFKAGQISVEGVECVTTLEKLTNLGWHQMIYTFPNKIAKAQKEGSDVVRCESVAVVDLKGLKASSLNARTLAVMKSMAKINQCFPEVLNCMIVLNAPAFFSFSWAVIRKFLDPRTAAKIKIFSDENKGKAGLFDRVDKDQILSDFDGTGPSFDEVLREEEQGLSMKRRIVELLSMAPKGKKNFEFELSDGETAQFDAYTRCPAGGHITIFKGDEMVKELEVKQENKTTHANGNEVDVRSPEPFRNKVVSDLKGPASFKVVVKTKMSEGKEQDHFLLVGDVH